MPQPLIFCLRYRRVLWQVSFRYFPGEQQYNSSRVSIISPSNIQACEKMKYLFNVGLLFVVASCNSPTSGVSEDITTQFQASGRTFVKLAEVVPSAWDKVCILGPYSTSKHSYATLGYAWPVEVQSSITSNDSITLLLFVKSQEVIKFVEHPRRDGDFANLSRQCFAREKATFHHQTNPKKGWPGLFPKN